MQIQIDKKQQEYHQMDVSKNIHEEYVPFHSLHLKSEGNGNLNSHTSLKRIQSQPKGSLSRKKSHDNIQISPKSFKHQSISLLQKKEEVHYKNVLVYYFSGSAGANEKLQITKDFLKDKIKQNQYLCDYQLMNSLETNDLGLITPLQQNGTRIRFEIQQFRNITPSINVEIEGVKEIAKMIEENYKIYDAFIILCGMDVICYIATIISFIIKHKIKVIFTGGYFPISYMRNDIINNLIESFAIISMAEKFNDVIIVCKNKGYRANRSIKMNQGEIGSVDSPNLTALVSVNIKIKFREYLFLPVPKQPFAIWTNISNKVGIIKFHILLTSQALQYQLNNPLYDGFVIESYGSSNLPVNIQILNIFKRAAELKNKIFINVAQPVKKLNTSIMIEYFESFNIFYGGDMTTEAALMKLSYLLSKNYPKSQIKKLIYTNLRGQLTEIKKQNQFEVKNLSFLELVSKSLQHYYPSNNLKDFLERIENEISNFIPSKSHQTEIEQIFKSSQTNPNVEQQIFKLKIAHLIDKNHLLHKAVISENESLYRYFLQFPINLNQEDQNECSPLFYAIVKENKIAVQSLMKHGCKVICSEDLLFDSIIRQLKKDNIHFFELLYHSQFKETLRTVQNCQGRNSLHLAAILKAEKSMNFMIQKFKFNLKQKDIYGKHYSEYISKKKLN